MARCWATEGSSLPGSRRGMLDPFTVTVMNRRSDSVERKGMMSKYKLHDNREFIFVTYGVICNVVGVLRF